LPGRRSASWSRDSSDDGVARLDEYADFIVGMIEDPKDVTLNEMVARLEADMNRIKSRHALGV
jgi:hypothetical protein